MSRPLRAASVVSRRSAPAPAGIRRATPYLPELESLRGWAIGLVFLHHVDFFLHMDRQGRVVTVPTTTPLLFSLVRGGHTGVSLFFLLSGFLLTLPLLRGAQSGRPPQWRRFFERRALRILPLYYVAVVVSAVAAASTLGEILRGVPYLFFLNAFPRLATPLWPYSAVWWSLATEAQFYVLLPLVASLLAGRTGRQVGLLFGLVWAVGYWFLLIDGRWGGAVEEKMQLALSLFGRGPQFLLGAAAAWVFAHHGAAIRACTGRSPLCRVAGDGLLVLSVLGLARLLQWVCSIGYLQAEFPPFTAWHLLEGLLWTVILLLVLLVQPYATRLLCHRVAGTVGVLSYSLYVVHFPLLAFVLEPGRGVLSPSVERWSPASVVLAVVLFALCSGLAAVTYRVIERPFLVRKALR
ncbi:MAG: acyltransferase family protein [Candidatus Binatia bacterium]